MTARRTPPPSSDEPWKSIPAPDKIPSELKSLDQWVLWRLVRRDGKPTKPPYQVNGQLAKSTDSSTWTSFRAAVAAYSNGGFSGIGFVLTQGTGIVGVDLDHCRDASTGEIESWALEIVERLDSYTEITPSATGLRIFVYGKLPSRGRKRGNVEMYDAKRFMTVTGWKLEKTQ